MLSWRLVLIVIILIGWSRAVVMFVIILVMGRRVMIITMILLMMHIIRVFVCGGPIAVFVNSILVDWLQSMMCVGAVGKIFMCIMISRLMMLLVVMMNPVYKDTVDEHSYGS